MSLKPQAIAPVLAETDRVARAAYPKGNLSMHMRHVLGSIYIDEDFSDLFPKDGQPAACCSPVLRPWAVAKGSCAACAMMGFSCLATSVEVPMPGK